MKEQQRQQKLNNNDKCNKAIVRSRLCPGAQMSVSTSGV